MNKSEIILLVGNIGSGKSTLIRKIINKEFSHVVISRDDLRYMIGAGKYRFDLNLEPAIWNSELKIIESFMDFGDTAPNLIIDEVGINKKMRKRYIDLAKKRGYTITVIEMPRYSKRKCVNRRMKDPHGQFDRKLWESVWEKFNKLYEKPSKKEGINKIIRK
jgi:predicted kinase